MQEEKIAKRYARAFMLAIKDDEALVHIERDLSSLQNQIKNPETGLSQLIENPAFNLAERKRALTAVAQSMQCHEMTLRLLILLVDKDRSRYFSAVVKAFMAELDIRLLRTRARITTAWTLGNEELIPIVTALSHRLGKSVVAETEVNPDVMGGVKAQIGGLVFDGTLQTRLQSLHRTLTLD